MAFYKHMIAYSSAFVCYNTTNQHFNVKSNTVNQWNTDVLFVYGGIRIILRNKYKY